MTRLENTQEVRDGEAAKHQAHGEQSGVGIGPLQLLHQDGDVAVRMVLQLLRHDWDEGVLHGAVQVVVVQDERMGLEDLRGKEGGMKVGDSEHSTWGGTDRGMR